MPEVKVLVEVIGGAKLVAAIDSSSTAQAAAEVLSKLVERPLVDKDGKKKNWKLFAPGKRGNITPLKPHASLSVASDWATSVQGTDKGGFAGPGEHEGEAYAFRVRLFIPKPPPPPKAKAKPKPIDDEDALDLTDMESDLVESVRHLPQAEPPKKRKRKRKRKPGDAATGEMKALKRKKRATGPIPVKGGSSTGEIKKTKRKRKKRANTGEMRAQKRPGARAAKAKAEAEAEVEKTVRSDPGEATVRTEPAAEEVATTPPAAPAETPAPPKEAAPEADVPKVELTKAEAARARVEAAKARVEAAKAAAAKAVADAAAAAAEAEKAEKAAAEAAQKAAAQKAADEKAAAEKAAAEKAAAEKAAAEKAAAEKAAAEKAAAEKAAAEKAAAEKAAAEKAAAEKAAAEKAAAEKAAAEKAAAEKAAAEKAAADKIAAEKAAAEKAAAEKAAAEKAAAEKAAKKASTERVVAISPITGDAPEPGQKAVTAKTRQLTRDEVAAVKAEATAPAKKPATPPLGTKPKKKDSNTSLYIALAVLLVVAAVFGYALLTRDSGPDTADAPPAAPPTQPTTTARMSDDLRIAAYTTGEGSADDAVAKAIAGYTSLNVSKPADLKDAEVRRKAAMVAQALEQQCKAGSRFDACDAWARVTFSLFAGCADGGCNGQESGTLIQASITATDLALTHGVALTDAKAKGTATRLLVAQAIRLGSQNQKLVTAQAPRVAALGLKSCAGSASGTPDCQALNRTK